MRNRLVLFKGPRVIPAWHLRSGGALLQHLPSNFPSARAGANSDKLDVGLDPRVREVRSRHAAPFRRRRGPVQGGDAGQAVSYGVPPHLDSGPGRAAGHVACGEGRGRGV